VARHASPHRRDFFCADWPHVRTPSRSTEATFSPPVDAGPTTASDGGRSLDPARPFSRLSRSPGEHRAGRPLMFYYLASYYLFLKAVFFFSLVRIQVRFDTMKEHWLFLGILYTAGVAFLSYIFLFNLPQRFDWADWQLSVARNVGISPEQAFVAETFLLSTLYFWLMAKFDEGVIFWTLLLLGVLVVWF
jgi:hypothetical protein